jgi:glycosyltransferase involved in cell wall biosynthesis
MNSDRTWHKKVSIVTPSFNQAPFIEEALWSVKNQACQPIEHIVVDGGSTDGTLEILKRLSSQVGWEHLRWISELDQGQSDALNKGFRMATGEIVGWLNSDDRYRPGCFRAVLDGFDRCPEADVLYGDYTWIDESGKITRIRREISFSYFVLMYHRVLYIPSTATFFKKSIFDHGHFVDTHLHYAMDYEFFVRLAQNGYRFQHISSLLADFRWHSQNKTVKSTEGPFRELDEVVRRNSPLLLAFSSERSKTFVLNCLRTAAAALRYTEKLSRGYYFPSWNRKSVTTV